MARADTPRLSRLAARVAADALLPRVARVVAACSGGSDSVALLMVLAELRGAGLLADLHVAHVNHGLRGDDSDEDEAHVRRLARGWDVPFHARRVDVAAERSRRGRGLQDAARAVRRSALLEVADATSATHVALAHTADDQAETLLLHLFRGSGARGLSAMRPTNGPWVRPLLAVRRAALRRALHRARVPWRSDRGNWTAASARGLLRPLVERATELFNPRLVEQLARTCTLTGAEDDLLEGLARQAEARVLVPLEGVGGETALDLAALRRQPLAIQRRCVRRLLAVTAGSPSGDAIDRVLRLTTEGPGAPARARIAGGHARREGDVLLLVPDAPPPAAVRLAVPGEVTWARGDLLRVGDEPSERPGSPPARRTRLVRDRIPEALLVRSPRAGDRFRPPGAAEASSLGDVLRRWEIPRERRSGLPLLTSAREEGTVLWVAGIGADPHLAAPPDDAGPLVLEWWPAETAGAYP